MSYVSVVVSMAVWDEQHGSLHRCPKSGGEWHDKRPRRNGLA